MSFPNKWRAWISTCLSASRTSILVNGAPTKEFNVNKGVRHGKSLSPFLFITAMEALNAVLRNTCDLENFQGIQTPNNSPALALLFYADNALFVEEWSSANFDNLPRILR